MAYRVVVGKPQRIRALASSTRISVADVKLNKAQAVVAKAAYAATVSSQVMSAFAKYAKPITQIQYQKLTAIDIALDPFSLNKYFRLESFGISDQTSLLTAKGFTETVGVTSNITSKVIGKGIADEAHIGDFAYILLEIQRAFNDALAMGDTNSTLFGLGKTESIGTYDVATSAFSKGLSDTPTLTEAAAFSLLAVQADATSVTDQLQRVVSFIRGFSDSAAVSETLGYSVSKPLTDSVTTTDIFARTVIYNRDKTDSVSAADNETLSVNKGLTDTSVMSEVLTRSGIFIRGFSDAFTLDDFTDVDAVQKDTTASKNNIVGFSDLQTFATQKGVQDNPVLSELAAIGTSRPASDGFSTSDVFQKVTTFSRAITETPTVSDTNSASFGKSLADTATLIEGFQRTVTFSRAVSDAVGSSDLTLNHLNKGVADSSLITESLQLSVASVTSSILNASALNTALLNN